MDWIRALLEKFVVTELVRTFFGIHEAWKFISELAGAIH
jgi:hypothetical protein